MSECKCVWIYHVYKLRKAKKIEIWFFREKVFITNCRVIENTKK